MRVNKYIIIPVLMVLMVNFQNCAEMKGINQLNSSSNLDPAPSPSPSPMPAPNPNPNPGNELASAELTWDANTEADLKEYRVYYGTDQNNLKFFKAAELNPAPLITIDGLQKGTTYYFAVTAINQAGEESPFSNIASKTP